MKKKVLIIKLSSLGDVIFNIPLANILKKNGYEVSWLVSEKGYKILKNNPCVDKVIFYPSILWKNSFNFLKNIKEFFRVIKTLRTEKYDIAIDSQLMFKSLFLLAFCGAKRRISSLKGKELSFLGGNDWVKDVSYHPNCHIVMNYLNYAKHLGCNINMEDIKPSLPPRNEKQIKKIDELLSDINKNKPTIVIAPATTWKNKHWNIDNWKKVIDYAKTKYNIIFTGNDNDSILIDSISNGYGINLAGKTDILELAEVFSRADAVITPDSGSAHLAWASDKPRIITIFTCTPPDILKPYGDKHCAVGGNTLNCQPCFKKKCKIKDKNKCTLFPEPSEIIGILEKWF